MKAVFAGLMLLFVAGCGSGISPEMVTGTVTLDGVAIEGAAVSFQPVTEGEAMPAVGTTDASGVFTLTDMRDGAPFGKGATAGDYRVGVLWFKPTGPDLSQQTGESAGEDQGKEGNDRSSRTKASGPDSLLPAAYQNPKTSGLTATVAPGDNTFVFELDSKFKPGK